MFGAVSHATNPRSLDKQTVFSSILSISLVCLIISSLVQLIIKPNRSQTHDEQKRGANWRQLKLFSIFIFFFFAIQTSQFEILKRFNKALCCLDFYS